MSRLVLGVATILFFASAAVGAWISDGPPPAGKDLKPFLEVSNESGLAKLTPQSFDLGAWEHRYSTVSNWPPAETDPPADILHYDLDLDFDLTASSIQGTARLTVEWGNNPGNVLRLDLRDLPVTAVRDGLGSPLAYTQDADGLDIMVMPPPVATQVVDVEIDYGGVPSQSFFVGENATFTFTEPEGSRYWFPCRDVPWDKATLTLHGTVDSGLTLVSNGVLDSTTVDTTSTTYHWREDHQITTYLIAVAIADYTEVTVSSPVTPLSWFVYPSHVSASNNAFNRLDEMMEFYDATLVPYPFDKYTMVEGDFGGGMEHQTCSLMGEFIVTGGQTWEYITAHELAHQWFGDLVTMADWRHIWLNEGFATFYDAVWHEDFYGSAVFDERMEISEIRVVNRQASGDHPVVDPPVDNLFSSLVYHKGSWVLRMLRDLVGKPAFDAGVTNYLTAHAYGNADTDDFRAAMEAASGQTLDWYFDQWLNGTGRPLVNYLEQFTPFPSGWVVQLDMEQVQSAATVFRFPLDVEVQTVSGTETSTIWVENAHETVRVPVTAEPLSVILDPANKILGEMIPTAVVGVGDTPSPRTLVAWPNPFARALNIVVPGALSGGSGEVQVFDVRGRRVQVLPVTPTGSVRWNGGGEDGRRLPPGAYFLRVPGVSRAVRVLLLPVG